MSSPLFTIPIRWQKSVFFTGLLVFSSFCSGVRIEIGSIGINPAHLILPVILIYVLVEYSKKQIRIPLFIDNISLLLYFVWITSLISTLLFSGLPLRSVTGAINFTFFIFLFIVSRWVMLLINPDQLVKSLLTSNNISAFFGISCLVIALITDLPNIGITYDHVNKFNIASISKSIPSIRSLAIEPNLFGIATASVLSIYIAIYLTWDRRTQISKVILLLGLALILSYTRSAFIATALALITMATISGRRMAIVRTIRFAIIFVLAIILLLAILPDESSFKKAIAYKLGIGILDFSGGTAIPRLISIQESFRGFANNPIFGNGIFSANNISINPFTGEVTGTAGPIGWLNGQFIQVTHDAGLLGLIGWALFYVLLFNFNYALYKRLPPSLERSIILGFIGGNLVILIGSQASSIVWLAFPFVYWAINLTVIQNFRNQLNQRSV